MNKSTPQFQRKWDRLPKGKTKIMGILNVTPDSFSDGGLYFGDSGKAIDRIKKMIEQGADIVDIGGESTRPGSDSVSEKEELKRIIPIIQTAKKTFGENCILSVDTYKSGVARQALLSGCDMVNSLGGMKFDSGMVDVIKEFFCPIILYHIRGKPKDMQKGEIIYQNGVVEEIGQFFSEQIAYGKSYGLQDNQFMIDPGIGFGKSVDQNIEIISQLSQFRRFGLPIVIGVSRKSHLGLLLKSALNLSEIPPSSNRLEASLAETAVAVLNGAGIVRTHDVLETRRFLSVLDRFRPRVLS